MSGVFGWIRRVIRELRRRRVIRVAVVYASAGFVILEAADILQPALKLPSWTVRFIAVLLALGFPLAVGLAWTFDVTEKGLVRTEEEGSAPSEIGPGGKPLTSNVIIVGLLIVAIGLLLYPRLFFSGERASGQASPGAPDTAQVDERSIAVLPFEPLSSGEESKTFAQGIHDDLLTRLANISALKVISRTAVQQYRNTGLTTKEIADSLGVRWVMEGGVQVLQGQIQVNAQLIDPRSETHAWADDYRRDLTAEDLFAIQGEITGEIAEALKAELTAGEQKRIMGAPTEDLGAYRLYVQGRSNLNRRTPEGVAEAADFFRRAVQEDSAYALAWAGLADAANLFYYVPDSIDAPEVDPQQAAERALELNPNLAEAHASLGLMQEGAKGLRSLRRAVELKPSYAQARHWLGINLLVAGHLERAREHLSLAVELAPEHRAARGVLAYVYVAEGKYETALAEIDRARREIPREEEPAWVLEQVSRLRFGALYPLGRLSEAWHVAQRRRKEAEVPSRAAEWRARLGMIKVGRGDAAWARRRLARVEEAPFARGLLRAALGEKEGAVEAFQEIEDWPTYDLIELRYFYPEVLGPIRKDPRYEELIRKINQERGLNPDGSIPEAPDPSAEVQADA